MPKYDTIVKNGCVVDGSGVARQFADIAIADGVIQHVSGEISASQACRVIDAGGKIVAPGVIDPHTHYDAQIHWDPYCTNSGWHGVTTVVVGNCGFGFMPCRASDRERYMKMMENTEQVPIGAMRTALSWDWETFPEWIAHAQRLAKGVNMAAYFPLNAAMIYVMGYEAAKTRPATKTERAKLRDMLNEAMDAGAIGFALSHLNEKNTHKDCDGTPMPTDMMHLEDAYALADVLRERGEGIIQALVEIPSIANRHVAEELAQRSRRSVLHNVVVAFDAMPEFHKGVLNWLEDCERRGLNIYSQTLSMRAWNEFNAHDFTAWAHIDPFHEFAHAGGPREKARLAGDPDYRARAVAQYKPLAMTDGGGAVETFILQRAREARSYEAFEGRLVGEIAAERGTTPIECFLDIVHESGCTADFRTTDALSHDPVKVGEILRHRRVLAGTSDGGAHSKFYAGGHYPTDNIMMLVREAGMMTLEEMHHKLSYAPARALGLKGRGALLEGYAADLYIYDFDRLGYDRERYEVVHDLPDGDWRRTLRAQGIACTMVNGEPTFVENVCTGATPGRIVSNRGEAVDQQLALKIAAE